MAPPTIILVNCAFTSCRYPCRVCSPVDGRAMLVLIDVAYCDCVLLLLLQGAPKSSTPAAAVVSLPLPAAPHGDSAGHASPLRYVADRAFDAATHAQDDVCNALLSDLLPALLKGGAGAASMLMCVEHGDE